MDEWARNIRWDKVIKAALLFTLIAFIARQVEVFLTMGYYIDPNYFGVWSKLMMPKAGPPPTSFMLTSLVFTFVTGLAVAALYDYIRKVLPAEKKERMIIFGEILICLSFVFFTLPAYLLFNLPLGLLVIWFLSSAAIFLIASYIFGKVFA